MINRSQKYQYFQNKALHYHNLRNMRSKIDHSSPLTRQVSTKLHRLIPYKREHQIQIQNKQLMKRLLNIAGTLHPQVINQGYSRFFNIDRPFRKLNPFQKEVDRQNTIENKKRNIRMMELKPAIGSTEEWNENYYKYKRYKDNLSIYSSYNKPRHSVCFSVDKFVPQQIKDFSDQYNENSLKMSKIVAIPHERLFTLPSIQSNRFNQQYLDSIEK